MAYVCVCVCSTWRFFKEVTVGGFRVGNLFHFPVQVIGGTRPQVPSNALNVIGSDFSSSNYGRSFLSKGASCNTFTVKLSFIFYSIFLHHLGSAGV